jgi:hypothetical protein
VTKLRGSRLVRAKLCDPVRLYVYGIGLPAIGGALFIDEAIPAMGEPLAALIAALGLVLGAEAARASAWSPRGVIREAGKLARLSDIERAADINLGTSRRA